MVADLDVADQPQSRGDKNTSHNTSFTRINDRAWLSPSKSFNLSSNAFC
jgi:hypothetical protein